MKPSLVVLAAVFAGLGLTAFDVACLDVTSREGAGECTQFAQGVQTCPVTLSDLSANRNDYDGKVISLVGYLAIDTSRLFLYPNKDAFDYADNAGSVYIDVEFETAQKLAESHARRMVQVVGTFSSRELGSPYGMRVGAIKLQGSPVVRDVRPDDESTRTIDFDVEIPSED